MSKRTLGIGLAVVAALLTSACAAGQHARTAEEQATLNGVNGDIGSIHIRGLVIESPSGPSYGKGDNAQLKLVLVNVGGKDDLFKGISSPAFADWGIFNSTSAADAVLNPAPSSSSVASSSSAAGSSSASPSGSETGSESPSTSASSTPSSSSSPLPAPSREIVIPAGGRKSFGVPEATGVLAVFGFSQTVYPGTTIPMTFQFAQAGSVTLQVPVGLSAAPNTSPIPELSTSAEA